MAKSPKYLEILESETLAIERGKKLLEDYAIAKKINKSTNLQLLHLFNTDPIYKKEISSSLYKSNHSHECWSTITNHTPREKKGLEYLKTILSISDNFVEYPHAFVALLHIVDHESDFLRPIDTWIPKTRNAYQQLLSLIRHLFTKYETPTFLEKSFLSGDIEGMTLYVQMGAGKSLKNYPYYPPNMIIHNKAAQYLYTTPDEMEFYVALRRIQVLYMGGDDYIFKGLMRSNILRERLTITRVNGIITTDKEEFWLTVMKFFIENTMIEPTKISEIVDYIDNVKYKNQRVYDANGLGRTVDPPQPGFSMKGRNPATLIDLSDEWHEQIARQNRHNRVIAGGRRGGYKPEPIQNYTWYGINLRDGEFKRGKDKVYRVHQLCSYYQLRDEGNYMHHCVATYAQSCSSGRCSIFSVRYFHMGMYVDTDATVEVRNNQVVQIRGKYNRKPNDTTIEVIKEWASREYVGVSSYAI